MAQPTATRVTPATTDPTCVIVLGVHRSGTSAMTGTLNALGVHLGDRLMPGSAGDNERGMFENLDIFEFHERLLGSYGRTWRDVDSPPEWLDDGSSGDTRAELGDLVRRLFGNAPLWAVKDPRLCRLLPIWLQVLNDLGKVPRFIVMYRHPQEVAASLARRNGFSGEMGGCLWVDHNLQAERWSRSHRRIFVPFTGFLEDPIATLDTIGETLGIAWPRSPGTVAKEIDDFLSPSLRHHAARPGRRLVDLGRFASVADRLHRALKAQRLTNGDGCESRFDHLARDYRELGRQFDPLMLEQLRHATKASRDEFETLRQQLDERRRWLETHSREIDQLRQQLGGQRAFESRLDQLESQGRDTRDERHQERETLPALVASAAASAAQLQEVAKRLDQLESQSRETSERLQSARDTAAADAREKMGELDRMRGLLQQSATDSTTRQHDVESRLDRLESELGNAASRAERVAARVDAVLPTQRRDLDDHLAAIQGLRAQAAHLDRALALVETMWRSRLWRLYLRLGRLVRWMPRPTRPVKPPVLHSVSTAARAVDVAFPEARAPEVSIVIPVYNQIAFTVQCLASILAAETDVAYEVVVIDDASTDETQEILSNVRNLRVVRHDENAGFIHSCNRGAWEASGHYLLFLNNDTEVSDHWLDRLLQTFAGFPDAGMVGAKLVFPDGTLQEAGGIVWRDGSAWNYGRGQDPDTPSCDHVRPVDYCSGACLVLPRQYFIDLGGFDTRYAPAYYEDVDLAFRIRETGKQVYYQPAARVIHKEGMSSGTDLTTGVKRHQTINAGRFYERWHGTLADHRAHGDRPDLARERNVGRRALIIDHRIVTPDLDAGSVRMLGLIEILMAEGYKVVFLPENLFAQQPYTRQVQSLGVEVLYRPFVSSIPGYLAEAGALYDLVIVSRAPTAGRCIETVREHCPQAKVIFDTVDLHYLRELRQAEVENNAALRDRAESTKREELAVATRADATLLVSLAEKRLLEVEAPEVETHVVSLIHEVSGSDRPFADRENLMFVGGFEHPPNVDAVQWLTGKIMPRVRESLPDVHLYIVGSKPTAEVLALQTDRVTVVGYAPTLDPYFGRCRISVAPLRFGAGSNGKLAHSMSHGLPCVATSLACEGMGLADGEHVRIADSPDDFARAVVELYRDEELWNRISNAGMAKTEAEFSPGAARRALRAAIG